MLASDSHDGAGCPTLRKADSSTPQDDSLCESSCLGRNAGSFGSLIGTAKAAIIFKGSFFGTSEDVPRYNPRGTKIKSPGSLPGLDIASRYAVYQKQS
jgi:hypothetical protein